MLQTCRQCSRTNPADAHYCYFDGIALGGHSNGRPMDLAARPFPRPFVFPSGRSCSTFDQLALACQNDWPGALQILKSGDLAIFFGSIGRTDLAQAAREAAHASDPNRGLDKLLGEMPTALLQPPRLSVEPAEINLGGLKAGVDHRLELRLVNQGMRLLYGRVACEDCVWLSLQEKTGAQEKVFQFPGELVVPVYVRGKHLAAHPKPREGHLVVESNGGSVTVVVRATVPVTPFVGGVLADALTPRQIAEKARARPREAAVFFENGAVAQWYRDNGWRYPVQGPSSSGLAAIQQFFEALGLAKAPRVELSQAQVQLTGQPGEDLRVKLEVRTREDRAVYALARSSQPWLIVESDMPRGRVAPLWLRVNPVPDCPGETLTARVGVRANGDQRFIVPVTLTVGGRARVPATAATGAAPFPTAIVVPAAAATAPPSRGVRPSWKWHLLPACLLLLPVLVMFLHDLLPVRSPPPEPVVEPVVIDTHPRLALQFHDRANYRLFFTSGGGMKDESGQRAGEDMSWQPTMRFGLSTIDPDNPNHEKRLTFRDNGITNNTCIRLNGKEFLYGETPLHDKNGKPTYQVGPNRREAFDGHWQDQESELGTDAPWGQRLGRKSVWACDPERVLITQTVEIVPGAQTRRLDTCLVRYTIENQDSKAHRIGLRFLLDTYIGSNDRVPFNLSGEMCDTKKVFSRPGEIPDFIMALENQDLHDPGTVAFLQLKVGGPIEPPERVTLGAYPDPRLQRLAGVRNANQQFTLWDVPVVSMATLADSAVVLYWPERDLEPGATRTVGFAYGLGQVANTEGGGEMLVTAGGQFVVGGDFTVTAYVKEPRPGQSLTLTLPDGLDLKEDPTKSVPPVAAGDANRNSTVAWKVHATRAGEFSLRVESSAGAVQSYPVRISSSIFLK